MPVARSSDFIRQRPASNFHHGIRIAEQIGFGLNLFVSINFSLTPCVSDKVSAAFQQVRNNFGKWVTRPSVTQQKYKAPPTFVWVIENPAGCAHAHWLVHVPIARLQEFSAKLSLWVETFAGEIQAGNAIRIEHAKTPKGAGRYMLKGMHPELAKRFDIRHEPQGWVTGKRIGFSKNVGPTQKARMRRQGKYPAAKHWVSFKKAA